MRGRGDGGSGEEVGAHLLDARAEQLLDLLDVAAGLAVGGDPAVTENRVLPRVVGGEGEAHVAVEQVEQEAQVLHPPEDVLAGVEGIGHPEAARGERHELHEPPGALGRDRHHVEFGFGLDDRAHEVGAHQVVARRVLDVVVELAVVDAPEAPGVDEGPLARVDEPVVAGVGDVRGLHHSVGVAPGIDLGGRLRGWKQQGARQAQGGHGRPRDRPMPHRWPRASPAGPPRPGGAARPRPRARLRPPGRSRAGRRPGGPGAS
jgi:hypothetical protein